MLRQAAKVWLSQEKRDDLERSARSRTLPVRLVERAQIVLRAAVGWDNQEIAEALGLCRQAVGRWRERFATEGLHGLEDRPRAGRPRRILEPKIAEVVRLTTQTTPVAATHWSTRTLAPVTGLSASTVGRIWRAHGLKPHRVKSFKLSNDPRFGEKLEDVVPLYLHPPAGAVVISVDEKCQIQALDRTQPLLPMRPGQVERRSHDYERHGTTSLFAALNTLTGEVLGKCYRHHRSTEFKKFLQEIDNNVPADMDIHLVLDNYGTHKTAMIHQWLLKRPRFYLHFTPTSSSWLNLVERWFGLITEKRIRRGAFKSTTELERAIRHYLETHNDDPKPFVWTKTADQILESLQRYCERISDSAH